MSINQNTPERKAPLGLPDEEEFEIVEVGGGARAQASWKQHAFNVGILTLIASASFGIGKIVSYDNAKLPISVTERDQTDDRTVIAPKVQGVLGTSTTPAKTTSEKPAPKTFTKSISPSSGPIVASRNGTKYYLVTCSGAKRINEENKIYFTSTEEARKAGLTPSSTCKGLK